MKVAMQVVKTAGSTHLTRAFMIDERWVDRLEKVSKGKICRVVEEPVTEGTPRRRPRRTKTEEAV